MNCYDVLFAVILRIPSENGCDIYEHIHDHSKSLGNLIQEDYEDVGVYPLGMEIVQDDMKVRILNRLEINNETPEED